MPNLILWCIPIILYLCGLINVGVMKKLVIFAATAVALSAIAATSSPKKDVTKNLELFNSLVKELQTYYVDSIDVEKSVTTAINAMLDDIDPYTTFIPYKDQEDFKTSTSGEYAGIGSYIMERDGWVYFSEPQAGSPAHNAGIKAGDKILMIDNDSTRGWASEKVSKTLKGQAGTKVKVTVQRPYVEDSILTFDLTRAKIIQPSVPYSGVIRDGIGFIELTSFTERSPEEVKSAFVALKEQNPDLKGLIFDLRSNGGGLLESACKIVGYFLPRGTEVLKTRGKGVMNERTYKTTERPIDTDIPLVVLIDGATASASEIVSGALQDVDRAVIIGSRSYGKGLVQSTRELPQDALLKVTTAKYYIPSGRLIQAIDYSNRNPDGSVSRIPDSLTNVFYTAGGREVRDGGGITPDISVEYPDVNRLTYTVVRDNWIFDYATKFAANNPTIAPANQFVVTDELWSDFKASIDPERFKYDKVWDEMFESIRKVVDREGYMNDSVEAEFTRLEAMLRHDLDQDLDINRKAISPYLSGEIVQRYYDQAGRRAVAVQQDLFIDTAINILNDPARYKAILTPVKKQKKQK